MKIKTGIEIEEISIEDSYIYDSHKYPNDGFYNVNGMITCVSSAFGERMVFGLGKIEKLPFIKLDAPFEEKNELYMSFDEVLKLIALTANKERYEDIKR